jgi:hypothetical protein
MNALERLSYFDGQRLMAADLAVEQCYQIMARRLLNQGLFTPGVVMGLEVDKFDDTHVRVKKGLALDPRGREMFVPSDLENKTAVAIPGHLPSHGGFYLVIRYRETLIAAAGEGCSTPAGGLPPGRIREQPSLEWTETWPDHNRCAAATPVNGGCTFDPKTESIDCAVVLATITLNDQCNIGPIDTSSRQYAYPIHVSQVHAIELEGEKDIDAGHSKSLTFQLVGGTAQKALLILQGDAFSSLFYTEMGGHSHDLNSGTLSQEQVDLGNHTHGVSGWSGSTDGVDAHNHALKLGDANEAKYVATQSFGKLVYKWSSPPYVSQEAAHAHSLTVSGSTSQVPNPNQSSAPGHNHTIAGAAIGTSGVTTYSAHGGDAYGYLNDLHVILDGTDITGSIVAQLPAAWHNQLGGGAQGDPLNQKGGTGPIDLVNQLGLSLGEGIHTLEFSVATGGGKVLWNLFIG